MVKIWEERYSVGIFQEFTAQICILSRPTIHLLFLIICCRNIPMRSAPRRAPAPAAPPAPVRAHQTNQPMVAQPQAQQPSMFKQMAATAGGVAVGSAIVSFQIFNN